MSITQIVRALGSWSLNLSDRTPQHIVDLLAANRFGHIAVDAARDNPEVLGDALLTTARYVGVLRGSSNDEGKVSLGGSGMAFWLGAEDGLGDVFETAVTFVNADFDDVARGLLPPGGAVTEGTFTAPTGYTAYTGGHRYQTPRQALDYFCDLKGADWRVNGDATVDAGPPEALFVTDPQAAVIRRAEGVDMGLRALPGRAKLDSDVTDFSTRVVTLAEGEGTSIQVGTADIAVNPYVDIHGNPIKLTRLVSESNTSATNANARAALALAQYTEPRDSLSLSTTTHDIRGDVAPGDSVWIYDPDAGLVDHNNEITFRGDRIAPVKLRVFQIDWPVEAGMGVYFRTTTGAWVDLTDYVEFESGQTNLTVGGYDRSLTSQGETLGFRPNLTNPDADSSVPGLTTFTTPFLQSLSTGPTGLTRAQVRVAWTPPALNVDGSAFVDGAHFEVRYRIAANTSSTWAAAAAAGTWSDLDTWDNPVPIPAGDWQVAFAPMDASVFLLQDLTPAQEYEFQIRAVDAAFPPNAGAWSASHFETLLDDDIPPGTPAAATVAGSLVQITVRHTLGLASGGTFNLPLDLAYLDVHVGATSGFTPDSTTRVGKIIATRAQINGTIPVVGTFPVATTAQVHVKVIAVDQAGNESLPSASAPVTATLIDSQWVVSLTADQITAGDFTATYGLVGLFVAGTPGAARFAAGDDGTRVGMMLHRPSGTLALHGNATTGDLLFYASNGTSKTLQLEASTGNITMYKSDGTTVALKLTASTGLIDMFGKLTAGPGAGIGRSVIIDPGASAPAMRMYPDGTLRHYLFSAESTTRPDATTAAGLVLQTRNASNQTDGFAIEAWSTNAWIGHKVTSGVWSGGRVIVERIGGLAGVFSDTGGISVNNTNAEMYTTPGDNIIELDNSGYIVIQAGPGDGVFIRGGSISLDGSVSTTAGVAVAGTVNANRFTTGGNGAGLEAQSGPDVRFYWAGGVLNIARNDTNTMVKTFVIDHPTDPDRFLVHGTTEGPEGGVEYRGVATITAHTAVVELPGYFEALTSPDGRTVHLTVELPAKAKHLPGTDDRVEKARRKKPFRPTRSARDGARRDRGTAPAVVVEDVEVVVPGLPAVAEHALIPVVAASAPRDGRFRIACSGPDGTRVAWLVKAARKDVPPLVVEPLRSTVQPHGDGPYRYLTPLPSLEPTP